MNAATCAVTRVRMPAHLMKGVALVANDEFFARPQAAAVLKHGILRRYSTIFATMAGSRTGRVVYFDGYAGPGRYDDGAPGSPLLAVRAASRTAKWGRQIECLFVESDPKLAANLSEVLQKEAPPELRYEVWTGDVSDYVVPALTRAGTDPLLAFLDPFGTPLAYEVLTRQLLHRPMTQPTEVLLNLNLEAVGRIGGLLSSKSPKASDQIALGKLDAAFGEWWRETFREIHQPGVKGSAAAAAQRVAGQYVKQVKKDTGYGYFGIPVRRRPGHQPLFLLILFSRFPAAAWKFHEQVSLASGEWRRAFAEEDLDNTLKELGQEPDLFGDNTATWVRESAEEAWDRQEKALDRQWIELITTNLRGLLSNAQTVRLSQRLPSVYGDALSLARDKHVNKAWDQLAKEGVAAPRPPGARLEYASIERAPAN